MIDTNKYKLNKPKCNNRCKRSDWWVGNHPYTFEDTKIYLQHKILLNFTSVQHQVYLMSCDSYVVRNTLIFKYSIQVNLN